MSGGGGSLGKRIWALAAKETLQIVRDRATLGMLLGVPLIQMLLFGFAIQLTPRSLGVTVVSQSNDVAAAVDQLLSGRSVKAEITVVKSSDAAWRELRRGRITVVIFADESPVRVLVDATDPVSANQAIAMMDGLTQRPSNTPDGFSPFAAPLNIEKKFNPDLRTQPYLVSGLLGLILTMTMVMMSALSLARERERGTLEGLVAVGARPLSLTIGKLAPYLLLGVFQGAAVLCLAQMAFDVHVAGSIALLALCTVLFAIANLALGFLFSNLASAQMPAMQMTFFFFLPSSLLSGFMFPFSAMPSWARSIGELLPLTHFLRIARGLILRAVDADYVWREAMPIAAFAFTAGVVSLLYCQRRLKGD